MAVEILSKFCFLNNGPNSIIRGYSEIVMDPEFEKLEVFHWY